MKRTMSTAILVSAVFWAILPQFVLPAEPPSQRDARLDWWRDARFGMFIHWGIYAVPADGEWYLNNHKVPLAQYEKFAGQFNPVKFDADQWAKVAHDAGMKYLVVTAKHHDGFCMFKTATTKYNVVDATPWGKDPLAELSAACQKHGVKFCCYYSIMDWHEQQPAKADAEHPEYNPTSFASPEKKAEYVVYMKAQLKELVTQYRPALLWFDGHWFGGWTADDGKDLVDYLHGLDPALVINDRTGGGADYSTPEQTIPARKQDRDWETCMTINNSWGFSARDRNFKSTSQLVRNLIDIVSKGGNYLLNVGPTAEGEIPQEEVDQLKAMGDWLTVNGDCIYGAQAGPSSKPQPWGRCTQKPAKLYLEVFGRPDDGKLSVPMVAKAKKAYFLAEPQKSVDLKSSDDGIELALPSELNSPATVIVVEIDGPARALATTTFVTARPDGSLKPTAADADIVGDTAQLEGAPEQNVGFWTNDKDYLRWTAKEIKPGEYQVSINYACPPDSDGGKYSISIGGQALEGTVKATGSWQTYVDAELGKLRVGARGPIEITLKPTSKPKYAVMNLRSITLKPLASEPAEPERKPSDNSSAKSTEKSSPYEIVIDSSQTPDLNDWAENKLRPVLEAWYPKIVADLPSNGYTPPKRFTVTITEDYRGVAATGGTRVTVSARWIRQQMDRPKSESIGSVVHELVHVVQQYARARGGNRTPGWLVEGIADYIRWWKFEPPENRHPVRATRGGKAASYTDSYQTTAAFLEFVTKNYDHELVVKLNAAARDGAYSPDLWKEYTGKDIDELWAEFARTLN